MSRFSKLAAVLTAAPVLAVSGSAFAGSPGQLAGGDNYLVKNLTQGGSYANTISASCNDEVQYSMQLSNTQFGALNNVTLKATLPSNGGVSTATATTDLGGVSGTTDTVTVNLGANQTQSLENGTTTLYDDNGHVIKTLPDTIINGVNIGTLNGSTTEFVNFKAKVNCPEQPTPVYSCNLLTLTADANDIHKYNGSVAFTALNGATLSNVNFNWGDGTSNDKGTTLTDSHTYAKDDTYKVTSTLKFNVNDTTQTAVCSKNITITTPPTTPPSTPPTPTKLPNTGPGSVMAIFAGVSTLAGVGHYFLSGRRIRG